ncbi:hypothetical protein HDU96_009790 [Phlyctochytrium bullatum]|nr:hypothetical protein HDU96_009790 [Phlyctochytrium bullatum]
MDASSPLLEAFDHISKISTPSPLPFPNIPALASFGFAGSATLVSNDPLELCVGTSVSGTGSPMASTAVSVFLPP